jgi:hypothetical protein
MREKMSEGLSSGTVVDVFRERWAILLTIVADAVFLIVWLCILWAFDVLASHLVRHESWEWVAARVVLAVGTLALIMVYLYWDTRAAYRRYKMGYERYALCMDSQLIRGAGQETAMEPGRVQD